MGKLSELKGVEKPVTEWLSKMGWTFKSTEELKKYSRPFSNPVITEILVDKTAEINDIDKSIAKAAVEMLMQNLNNPTPILGNEIFMEKLAHYFYTYKQKCDNVHLCSKHQHRISFFQFPF